MSMTLLNFQTKVKVWMAATFTPNVINSRDERNHRFFEEATELIQANGVERDKAHRIVDYVFDRPVGELPQEVAGVGITLAALVNQAGISLDEAFAIELKRIWEKRDLIRQKQAAKPKDIAACPTCGQTETHEKKCPQGGYRP